jgi:hypothetical protein
MTCCASLPPCSLRVPFSLCSLQGAAFSYNGYFFFPIKPPTFWVTAEVVGRKPEIIKSGDSFLIYKPMPVQCRDRFEREVRLWLLVSLATWQHTVCMHPPRAESKLGSAACMAFPSSHTPHFLTQWCYASWNGSNPSPLRNQPLTADGYFPGPPKGGGGILLIPAVAGSYILKGVSYYEPEDITSPLFEVLIYISLRTCRWGRGSPCAEPCSRCCSHCGLAPSFTL